MFTIKSEVLGWPCKVSDDSVQNVGQKKLRKSTLHISELSREFP
jgi:hypothetical protein